MTSTLVDTGEWVQIADRDPLSLASHRPEWIRALTTRGGYDDATTTFAMPDGRRFVAPMVRNRFGIHSSFGNGMGIGGLVGPPRDTDAVRRWFELLLAGSAPHTIVRPNPLEGAVYDAAAASLNDRRIVRTGRRAHVVELPDGAVESCWNGNARRNLRRAQEADLRVESSGGAALIPVLHDLLRQSVRRWAEASHEPQLLAQLRFAAREPLAVLRDRAAVMGDSCRVWVAWVGSEPAAAVLVLFGRDAHYTRGAMNRDLAGPTHANYLLHQHAMRHAVESGCRHYHMGDTGTSESLGRFKRGLGAREIDYAGYTIERLPLGRVDRAARTVVKKAIGFRE